MDVGGNKVLHVGPPVVLGEEMASFEDSGVASGQGIVIEGCHSPPKVVVCHNDEMGAVPPGTVRMLLKIVGITPGRNQHGESRLGSADGSVEVNRGGCSKKEGV
jgi:hypothetical protein